MNYALKIVLNKVIKNYLNLSEQLELDSGVIKMAAGTLNHDSLNQKLKHLDIQIQQSTYKGLNIGIPVMQLMSKPIKVKIELFQVLVHIGKPNKKKKSQQQIKPKSNDKTSNQIISQWVQQEQSRNNFRDRSRRHNLPKVAHYREDSPSIILKSLQKKQPKQLEKAKSNKNATLQQTSWSGQYVKQMVNRILYNLQVSIQKAKITVVINSQVLPQSQTINLQVNQLHIRNSILNLQANIIKKTINLKQLVLFSQRLGAVKIQDFNVGIDYAFSQLKIIAILWNVRVDFGKLTNLKEKQSFFVKAIQNFLKKSSSSQKPTDRKQQTIQEKIQFEEQKNSIKVGQQGQKKQKLKTTSIYLRINQISVRAFRLLLKSQNLQSRVFLNNVPQQYQKTFSLNLNSINFYSTYNKDKQDGEVETDGPENCLLQIKAIKRAQQEENYFKSLAEYEDTNLKNALISYDHLEDNLVIKAYHLIFLMNYSKAKNYIQNILDDYYDLFGKVLLVFKLRKQVSEKGIASLSSISSQTEITIAKSNKNRTQLSFILYKAMIIIEDFISTQNPIKEQKIIILLSKTLTHNQMQTSLRIIEFKILFNQYQILQCQNIKLFIERERKNSSNQRIKESNITIAGGDLISQCSLSTLLRLSKGLSKIVSDIADIHILFDRFLRRETRKIIQKQRNSKRKSDQISKLKQLKQIKQAQSNSFKGKSLVKRTNINFKMHMVQIKIGHYLFTENKSRFYTALEVELSSIVLQFSEQQSRIPQKHQENQQCSVKSSAKSNIRNPQLKLKFDMLGYFYSPHTMEKAPFTNEVKIQISKLNKEFSVVSKNSLNINLDDCFIKVIQLYSKSQLEDYQAIQNDKKYDKKKYNSFAKIVNCTNQELVFCQNRLRFSILPHQTTNIFFQGTKGRFILIEKKEDLQGNSHFLQISSKEVDLNAQSIYEKEEVLCFDHREEKNIFLSWISSQQILIKNKFLVGFYPFSNFVQFAQISYSDQDIEKQRQKINIKVKNMGSKQFLKIPNFFEEQKAIMYNHYQDASILQQIAQESSKIKIKISFQKDSRMYNVDNLMKNQKFGLYGLRYLSNPLYDYYILERKSLSSVYMQILPFLVIENQLQTELYIRLKHRKTQQIEEYSVPPKDSLPILSNPRFDFYMKQFTFAVMILPTMSEYQVTDQNINIKKQDDLKQMDQKQKQKMLKKQSSKEVLQMQSMEQFLSEQHYFNTFFMVEDQFQTVIQLRSDKKNRFQKEYLLITESILCKTKVLTFSSPMRIINKSSFNLGFEYRQRVGLSKKMKILKSSSIFCQLQVKDGDVVNLLYEDLPENKIEVTYKNFNWALNNVQKMVLLFFNFCKVPQEIRQSSNQNENTNFYQVAVALKFSVIKGVQTILFQDLIQLTNLTKSNLSLNQRSGVKISYQDKVTLMLPSTTDFRYNNKAVQMNIGISEQMENLYKSLFLQNRLSNSTVKKDQSGGSTPRSSHQLSKSKISQNPILIHFSEYPNWEVSFNELLVENSKETPTNEGKQKKIFTLLKDLKSKMTFFICQDIYNTNGHYTIFRNSSDRHFLMNLDKHEYSNHFKAKGMNQEEQQIDSDQEQQQKILIQPFSCNKMIQRKNQQVLLCDQKQSHLHKLTKQTLSKQEIKFELHEFSNFSLYDVGQDTEEENKFQVQLITNGINVKVRSKSTVLALSLNALTFRMLERNKFDCLLTDITISEEHNGKKEQILFVPEQAYFLLQGKTIDQKFYLIKNMFIKCKHAILNIHDKLPNGLLALYKAFGLQEQENKNKAKNKTNSNSTSPSGKQESDLKLRRYLQESIFLVKNIYIHEIHLSLTIKMQTLDFSNTITLIPFSLSSKTMKSKNLKSQISKFYLTNMLAKFPKLSFFLQNLKNPMSIIKTLSSINKAIKDKILIQKIIKLNENPQAPKYFSLQAYNLLNGEVRGLYWVETSKKYYIIQKDCLVILSTTSSQRHENTKISLSLLQLQKIKMIRNKAQSEISMKFKDEINVNFYAPLKRCEYFMYIINSILD